MSSIVNKLKKLLKKIIATKNLGIKAVILSIAITLVICSVVFGAIAVQSGIWGKDKSDSSSIETNKSTNKQTSNPQELLKANSEPTNEAKTTETEQTKPKTANQPTQITTNNTPPVTKPAPNPTPAPPRPDYNLNNNYYIAEGSAGYCSIDPGENTMCPVEYRMEPVEFFAVGVTESASHDNLYAKVVQYGKTNNVYSPQAGAMSAVLTESKCTAYSINCGRW